MLLQRGIRTFDEARTFFRPQITHLHDPWLMKGMHKAVERIDQAVKNQEKILIYGDYDVDGTTAVATVYSFMREYINYKNPDAKLLEFYIPNRYREGYGISKEGINYAKKNHFSLMIALDCGIKAVDKIKYAHSLGLDVIVCDHHLPDHELPPAYAILNPKQPQCAYPYKELSGCGIGFKLITALAQHWQLPEKTVENYLDLVATSIAADIVPMTGENRVLVYYGLKKVNTSPRHGIEALARLSGLKKTMRVSDLVFMIAPRINAAGRMDDAHKAVHLFIEKDPDQAMAFAEMLHQDNADRKDLDKSMTEEILSMIEENVTLTARKTTVLFNPDWHKGVIGIVASRVMETYYRPTIILTKSNEQVSGSARSVKGFNIYQALDQCVGLLENYGGHFYAAGMTLKPEMVESFIEKFEEVVAGSIDPDMLIPVIQINASVRLQDLTPEFFKMIQQFEPFGPGNMPPVFQASNVYDNGYSKIIRMKHIRFEIKQNNAEDCNETLTGIGFNMAHKFDLVASGKPFDICFTLDENEWNGKISLQLRILDIRPTINVQK